MTPEAAVAEIHPRKRSVHRNRVCQPMQLVKALARRRRRSCRYRDRPPAHAWRSSLYAEKSIAGNFRINSFFIAATFATSSRKGSATTRRYSFRYSAIVFQRRVAPRRRPHPGHPARRSRHVQPRSVGRHRQGRHGDAGLVIAQVNLRMPRTMGDSYVHVQDRYSRAGGRTDHRRPATWRSTTSLARSARMSPP